MTNLEIGFNTLARQNWMVKIIADSTPLFKSVFVAIAIPPSASINGKMDLSIAKMEKLAIKAALAIVDNNKTAAAKRLGITRKVLYHKLKTHGIIPERDETILIGA